MWGNKQGWIISALIAAFMGWLLLRLSTVGAPTRPTGEFPYLTAKIELPAKPETAVPIFTDNTTGILGLHWARQLGKSTVLAAWAVDRLLTRPGVRGGRGDDDGGEGQTGHCDEAARGPAEVGPGEHAGQVDEQMTVPLCPEMAIFVT